MLLLNLFVSIFIVKQKRVLIGEDERNNLFILNCFSIGISLLIYPIVNMTHFLFATIIAIILFIYIINIIIKKGNIKLEKINFIINFILIILIFIDIVINSYKFIQWGRVIFSNEYYYNYNEPYFGTIVEEDIYKNIDNVTNYIKENENAGKDVIVFSSKAALYMVPLNESNGFYDLPFNGNFGNLSKENIVSDLEEKKNTLILIEKDENNIKWQENKFILQAIMKKFKYIGDIEEFGIYTLEN